METICRPETSVNEITAFLDVELRRLAVNYRRFRTNYRLDLQESSTLTYENGNDMSSRKVGEWDHRPSWMWSCADWQLITDVSGPTIGWTFKSQAPLPMKIETICRPETSVTTNLSSHHQGTANITGWSLLGSDNTRTSLPKKLPAFPDYLLLPSQVLTSPADGGVEPLRNLSFSRN